MVDCKRELHGLLQEEVRQHGAALLPSCFRVAVEARHGRLF
jgi:hypothetical protein